jgi:SAM-dependent methyltransferase
VSRTRCLASWALLASLLVLPQVRAAEFPAPARPVAPVVSAESGDEAARDAAGEAARVLDRLGVGPGLRVADLGAGEGYYTVRLAARVAPSGVVYAEDIQPQTIARLGARLQRERLSNVILLLGLPRDPLLPPASVDVVILGHVYHEIENPFEFLYRLRPALAPGARVAVVEADRATQDHGTPRALLACEMAAVGYRQVDILTLAPAAAYVAVFTPPEALPPVAAIRPCRP